jgi:hypothetical protein
MGGSGGAHPLAETKNRQWAGGFSGIWFAEFQLATRPLTTCALRPVVKVKAVVAGRSIHAGRFLTHGCIRPQRQCVVPVTWSKIAQSNVGERNRRVFAIW